MRWLSAEAATTKPETCARLKGDDAILQPGQLCCSIAWMADEWGWDVEKVERYLGLLQKRELISMRKVSKDHLPVITFSP